jgi:NAD(P)-dependent dehydrogenase (short-subunit alcohol dehydrogenase family)
MQTSHNKIALVTGGSRGLGRDTAFQLAKNGFDIIITYQRQHQAADKVVAEIQALGRRALALPLDLAHASSFQSFVDTLQSKLKSEFGADQIDALVNNAGSAYHATIAETSEHGFDEMVNVHLKAPFFLTQKLLPLLRDGASIVNTSSGLARFSYPGYAAYAIMKAGIDSLTRYQALELGNRQIRVNSIAPGAIATDFGGGAVRDNEQLSNMIASQTALGRIGLPDDIGGVAAFLCGDESRWINAQRIEVAGGIHI